MSWVLIIQIFQYSQHGQGKEYALNIHKQVNISQKLDFPGQSVLGQSEKTWDVPDVSGTVDNYDARSCIVQSRYNESYEVEGCVLRHRC